MYECQSLKKLFGRGLLLLLSLTGAQEHQGEAALWCHMTLHTKRRLDRMQTACNSSPRSGMTRN